MKKSKIIFLLAIGAFVGYGIYFWFKYSKVKEVSKSMDLVKVAFEEKNYSKAAELLHPLVKIEYAPAMEQMAILYAIGEGVKKSDERGLGLVQKASIQWLKEFSKAGDC